MPRRGRSRKAKNLTTEARRHGENRGCAVIHCSIHSIRQDKIKISPRRRGENRSSAVSHCAIHSFRQAKIKISPRRHGDTEKTGDGKVGNLLYCLELE